MTWFFNPLLPLSYDVIMIDPAWTYKNWSKKGEAKNPSAQYQCMTLDAIKAMPVAHLAAKDCFMWLWATHPMLPQALEAMKAWGFEFVTSGVWVKRTVNCKMRWGTGYVLRSTSEPFIIGRIGKPKIVGRRTPTVLGGLAREHSRKPDSAYERIEKMTPNALRRADTFSREPREGWDAFGDEIGKFDEAV